jgi:hypothetical protein
MKKPHLEVLRPHTVMWALVFVCWTGAALGIDINALRDDGSEAVLAYEAIGVPAMRVILIDDGRGLCELRLSPLERKGDAQPETAFRSGDETQSRRYEWQYALTGSTGIERTISGKGSLVSRSTYGIGRAIVLGGGNRTIKCGPMRLQWGAPGFLSYGAEWGCGRRKVRIAPTSWRNFSEVQADDKRLRWYDCHDGKEAEFVPLQPE